MPNIISTLATFVLLGTASVSATAGVVYTTGTDSSGTNPAFDTGKSADKTGISENNFGVYIILAAPFELSSDSAVTDLLLPLSKTSTGSSFPSAELDLYIVDSVGGLPDTDENGNPNSDFLYEGTFNNFTSTTPQDFDVALSGSATLTASTQYYLLAKITGTAPNTAGCPTSGSGHCPYNTDSWWNYSETTTGATPLADSGDGWTSTSSLPPAFTLLDSGDSSTSTPEPASAIPMGTGLAALAAAIGFRRRVIAAQ